jgi:hypothetical protein
VRRQANVFEKRNKIRPITLQYGSVASQADGIDTEALELGAYGTRAWEKARLEAVSDRTQVEVEARGLDVVVEYGVGLLVQDPLFDENRERLRWQDP